MAESGENGTTRFDYGLLRNDAKFIQNSENLAATIEKLQEPLAKMKRMFVHYANLTIEEKVRYDALCAYCVNALYWMHATMAGHPATIMNDIKSDLERVREAMKRHQVVHDSLTKRPRLDKAAAGRFVRAGLYDENEKKQEKVAKKRTFVEPEETDQPAADEQPSKLGKKKNNKKLLAEQDDGETAPIKNEKRLTDNDTVQDEQPSTVGPKKKKMSLAGVDDDGEAAIKPGLKKKKQPNQSDQQHADAGESPKVGPKKKKRSLVLLQHGDDQDDDGETSINRDMQLEAQSDQKVGKKKKKNFMQVEQPNMQQKKQKK